MRRVCVVIMWSLKTRIEKSYSYSYSNLKVPNISKGTAFLLQGVTENDSSFKRYKFKICAKITT